MGDVLDISRSGVLDMTNPIARKNVQFSCDFLTQTAGQFAPFTAAAIATGTLAAPNTLTAEHPGVVRMRSSTSANSGYLIGTNSSQLQLAGGEVGEIVFYTDPFANNTYRHGFHNSVSSVAPVDGVYLEIDSSGVATGKTANNSTRSSTASTYTLTAAAWYRLRIDVNDTLSTVTFSLFNDSGTLLWTDTITTNIPVPTRSMGFAAVVTNSGTTATDLMHLDYMSLTIPSLAR